MINAAKRITATGDATTGPTRLRGVIVQTAGTGSPRLTLRNDTATGTVLFDVSIAENSITVPFYFPDEGIRFDAGVHVATLTAITAVTLITG